MTEKDCFSEIIWDPQTIENTSMAEIEKHIGALQLDEGQRTVVKRIVHTTGDLSLAGKVKFHPRAVEAGLAALAAGARVFTDVNMVRAGINLKKLRRYGGTVCCAVHRPEVAEAARKMGITRSAAAMRLYGPQLNNQLVAVGNAPTALFEVLRMVQQGTAVPALVVGIPVGFVGAAESKALLTKFNVPYITLPGTRGGSPVAAAVVNALIYMLEEKNG
ncbi:precorrin-8X/cobalt-precorrin-8 methylmutase [Desulfohalotomaculum tongense]|uniref:precorrin-8X methylmutase n=1 Tax=Desulforadius tongensis TaxID=1216062 RepID=UPI001EE57141|nr:precorrin-8X methylmutase [Desulforadius tongensis]MBM7854337.1 precorrin-8X/cobalt-precorrin-8 methylmutase [Desulforadius tongensis]